MRKIRLLSILAGVASIVSISFLSSCSDNKREFINNFSFESYKYDVISEVTDTDSLAGEDAMLWRSMGQGILPTSSGKENLRVLRDSLQALGYVEFQSGGKAVPRKAAHLKLTENDPDSISAGNYSINNLTIQHFSPSLIVWKSYLTYYLSGFTHPRFTSRYLNYSIDKEKILSLNDIFRPGYEPELLALLKERLENNEDLFNDAEITIPDTYYLTSDGITFVYGLYEIAPYYAGEVEVNFKFFELDNLLQPGFE